MTALWLVHLLKSRRFLSKERDGWKQMETEGVVVERQTESVRTKLIPIISVFVL